jgi:prepilin-type N-terminal cleavage/methylation domain-containing protein
MRVNRPFSFTSLRRRLDAIRANGLDESGYSMIELVISMSILVIVSTMAVAVLVSIQNTTKLVSWQSNANTELRQFVDSSFADLGTARPRTVCFIGTVSQATLPPGGCVAPAKAVEGLGSALESAGTSHVCYLSHRTDPVANPSGGGSSSATPAADVTNYAKVCLIISDKKLWKVVWQPTATNLNQPDPATVTYSMLGAVDDTVNADGVPATYFRYFGKMLVDGSGTRVTPGTPAAATAKEVTRLFEPVNCSTSTGRLVCSGSKTATTFFNPAARSALFNDYLIPTSATPPTGMIAGDILNITRVQVVVSVITKDKRHARALEYEISLRGSKYQNERCYSGELSLNEKGELKCA